MPANQTSVTIRAADTTYHLTDMVMFDCQILTTLLFHLTADRTTTTLFSEQLVVLIHSNPVNF